MADVFRSHNMTVLASEAASQASRTSDDIHNPVDYSPDYAKGLILHLNLANKAGTTAEYTPQIEIKLPNGDYADWWVAAAAAQNNGNYVYLIYPANLEAAAADITDIGELPAPTVFRVVLTVANADGSNNCDTLMTAQFLK